MQRTRVGCRLLCLLAGLLCLQVSRAAEGGDLDLSFNPGSPTGSSTNERISAMAVQADGKVVLGGFFTTVNGAPRGRVARVLPDGTLDTTYMSGLAGANLDVECLALQPDGKVLIGGLFQSVNGVGRSRIARLNADGSLDTTFLNGMSGASWDVKAVTLQPDGKVLIGGGFGSVNGAARGGVARLNPDGSLDATFGNGIQAQWVYALALQPDGKVLIGGDVGRVTRLNADGSVDPSFTTSGVGSTAHSLAVQPDGKVLVGFAGGIVRLNADGSRDGSFSAQSSYDVRSVVLQADGKILIGGDFSVGGQYLDLARLDADGSLDSTFQQGAYSGDVYSVVVQPDQKILIGGEFTQVQGKPRARAARLDVNGNPDGFFSAPTGPNSTVEAILPLPDGNFMIGGFFSNVNAATHFGLARLHGDGSLDPAWYLWAAGIYSLVRQPDGKMLLGGAFTNVSTVTQAGIYRLTLDPQGFDMAFPQNSGIFGSSAYVRDVVLQPDGKILIGGFFSAVNGVSRSSIARLNANGTLDPTFLNGLSGVSGQVYSVDLQSDGKVLIGGNFTSVNGVTRNKLARLNADGSLDTSFVAGLTGIPSWAFSVVVQPDGKILVGGNFTSVNGVIRNRIVRLNADGNIDTTFLNGMTGADAPVRSIVLEPDGKILVGGEFTTIDGAARGRIARLNSDGSLDTTFGHLTAGANGIVHAVELDTEGRVLIGGEFTSVNGVGRAYLARLFGEQTPPPEITTQPADQTSFAGCCAMFHVTATGAPLTYHWRRDGVDLVDGGHVSGSATATLILTNLSAADEGAYSVFVSNDVGSDLGDVVFLSLGPPPTPGPCQALSCDPAAGCGIASLADGTSCDDGNACTVLDRCTAGACGGPIVPGPAEVDGGVRLARIGGGNAQISWNLASGASSSDVLRGSAFPVGSGAGEVCLASDLQDEFLSDATVPDAGPGYWYLIRGRSDCGSGSYGFEERNGTPTAPRVTTTCP